jgi:hypothetical protein
MDRIDCCTIIAVITKMSGQLEQRHIHVQAPRFGLAWTIVSGRGEDLSVRAPTDVSRRRSVPSSSFLLRAAPRPQGGPERSARTINSAAEQSSSTSLSTREDVQVCRLERSSIRVESHLRPPADLGHAHRSLSLRSPDTFRRAVRGSNHRSTSQRGHRASTGW